MHELLAVTAAVLFPVSADAAVQVLTVTGHINYIGAVQRGQPASAPSELIALGDTYTLTARFDPAVAQPDQVGVPDPTTSIYDLPGATILFRAGSYSTTLSAGLNLRSWAQFFNDTVSGSRVVDGQVFGFHNFYVGSSKEFPFSIGQGTIFEAISAQAFDYTGTARVNILISDIQPYSKFGSKGISYSLRNYDTGYFAEVHGNVTDISLASVPEPATWTLMIMGFGAIAAATRQRRAKLRVTEKRLTA
ncbi:PEPxxWA-CTERM sorting domain-containing protein [Sphingomonas sp. MMSM20]|uniref:PEPxxWA-CTERM sorting domain-containing protein n=1 Tax=Sphingomonas lycopersici TaxID=2951807 RepID=UPI0022372D32|nr:PEPxxWA-CTERM sorting domain-containing protein [Sphingomonas lycopersici]MCW6531964.1 PEPxxWA-CTERM sorting domain-containing protein [Sphingomonas lycopersici]